MLDSLLGNCRRARRFDSSSCTAAANRRCVSLSHRPIPNPSTLAPHLCMPLPQCSYPAARCTAGFGCRKPDASSARQPPASIALFPAPPHPALYALAPQLHADSTRCVAFGSCCSEHCLRARRLDSSSCTAAAHRRCVSLSHKPIRAPLRCRSPHLPLPLCNACNAATQQPAAPPVVASVNQTQAPQGNLPLPSLISRPLYPRALLHADST